MSLCWWLIKINVNMLPLNRCVHSRIWYGSICSHRSIRGSSYWYFACGFSLLAQRKATKRKGTPIHFLIQTLHHFVNAPVQPMHGRGVWIGAFRKELFTWIRKRVGGQSFCLLFILIRKSRVADKAKSQIQLSPMLWWAQTNQQAKRTGVQYF